VHRARVLYKRACNRCLALEAGDGGVELAVLSEMRAQASPVSYEDLLERMPYLSLRTLQRVAERLLQRGAIGELSCVDEGDSKMMFVTGVGHIEQEQGQE